MFETRAKAQEHADAIGIKTKGLFRKNRIKKNKADDGTVTFSIENRFEKTSITDLGGDIGIKTIQGWHTPYDKVGQTNTLFTITDHYRDSNLDFTHDRPSLGGPLSKGVKGAVTFASSGISFKGLTKGLKYTSVKAGKKYKAQGKSFVRKIYRSFRKNGYDKVNGSGKNTKVIINQKTGERIIFRKSKTGGYKSFDTITKPLGKGKNESIFFN